ncbi:MAG: sigma 54-interacting transcriptional regulator [Proteobacteria bacterium]|nr:sigma 54-interacting transcriptional regulator [Pseudomonadota bacterium]
MGETPATQHESGPDDQRIFSLAALFDGDFSIDWLQEVSREKASRILLVLDRGLRENWLTQTAPGLFRFADPEKQQRFLKTLPRAGREDLHLRTAGILLRELPDGPEKDRVVARLLLHVTNDLDGCRRLAEEGNYFRKMFRHREALQFYEKAIEDLDRIKGETADRLLIEATIQYSKISAATLDAGRVNTAIHTAIQRAGAPNHQPYQALLKMHLAKHEWLRSNFRTALNHFDQGWAMASRIDDPSIHRPAVIFSMFFHFWQGRFRDAVESYEKYAPEIENVPKGGFPLLARLTFGTCYGHCGQISQGLGMLDSLREHCLKTGNIGTAGHASTGIALIFSEIGHFAEAARHYDMALDETIKGHNNFGRLAALLGLAYMSHKLDDNKKAVAFLREFLELSSHAQMYFRYLPTIMDLCWSMERGLLPRVEGLSLQDEIAETLKSQNIYMRGMGHRYRALVKKRDGHPSREIIRDLDQAVKWIEISGHQIDLARTRLELAREFLRTGREERARALAGPSAKLLFSINEALIPDDLRSLVADLRDRKNLLDEILKLGQEMVTIRDNREVAVRIISAVNRVTGAERGAMFLRDGQKERLTLRAAKNLTPESLAAPDFQAPMNIIEQTFRSGRGRVLELDPVRADASPAREAIRSCVCVPMTLRNQVIGVLYHDNRLFRSAFREDDLEILGYFAAQAAIAMDNAQAYEILQEMFRRQREEKQYFEEQYLESLNFEDIVGKSPAIRRVFSHLDSVAGTDATVLILGETGVGKELVARAIHRNSPRREGPFIRVNCSAFSEHLISSELFGHEKGAFTGATRRRIGRFELANEGTIFLDEIGDIPLEVQVRLLRVLQSKEFERVGGQETIRSDFRLMAATNRDLEKQVEAGRFRKDLFYRLNVFPIHVPPLRERREDVPLLAYHFLQIYAKNLNKKIDKIPPSEMQKLMEYPWPGNVRELENIIERGVILSSGPYYQVPDTGPTQTVSPSPRLDMSIEENERAHILRVLEMTGGRIRGHGGAAEILNIHPNTLYSRMKKLGISTVKRQPPALAPRF